MAQTKWRDGVAYLQIRQHGGWELRPVKVTQRRPEVIEPGCIVVKIRFRVPDRVFEPFEPEAVIVVPEELAQRPIEAEAVDPS